MTDPTHPLIDWRAESARPRLRKYVVLSGNAWARLYIAPVRLLAIAIALIPLIVWIPAVFA